MFTINNISTDSIETYTICKHLHEKYNIFFNQSYINNMQAKMMLRLVSNGADNVIYGQRTVLVPVYSFPKWYDDNLLIKKK